MIRGKIVVKREVKPKRITFGGPSPFIKINGEWALASDHTQKAKIYSLAKFLEMERHKE